MNEWATGDKVTNGVRLFASSAEVTAGTATIRYAVNDAGTTKWLQDDLSTLSTTFNTIDIAHTANEGFVHDLTIPPAMDGMTGTFTVTDPSTGLDIYSEPFEVGDAGGGGDAGLEIVVQ